MSQFSDLLKPSRILPISIKFIEDFGLETAAYLTVLLDAPNFSVVVGQITDIDKTYFVLNRQRITSLISIPEKTQKDIDDSLIKIKVLSKSSLNAEAINLDEDALLAYIGAAIDVTPVAKKPKYNKKSKAEQLAEKRRFMLGTTIKEIKAIDPDLRDAYETWLRTIFEYHEKTGTALLEEAETKISDYSGGNVQVAIEVLKIATAHTWIDVQYAIQSRENQLHGKSWNVNSVGRNNKTTVSSGPVEVEEKPFI